MIIALASPSIATTLDDGLAKVRRLMSDAASQSARIVCFPENYLPGYRGLDFDVPSYDLSDERRLLDEVSGYARELGIATILGMEHIADEGRQISAVVFDADGALLGRQVKTQLDPSEDATYVTGTSRTMFEFEGLRFGVVICHEGFRYPETVRWAATRGAKVVFHPHLAGSVGGPLRQMEWGANDGPYYEQAMAMRSRENTIWFASVNYALPFPESATSLIDPSGECRAFLPHGEEGVLVCEIDLDEATGQLASRFAPERM